MPLSLGKSPILAILTSSVIYTSAVPAHDMAPSAVRSQNFVSTTPKRDPFADSEHYPLNSPTWRDPISVDLKRCKKDLNEAGTKIFGSVTQFDVVAVNYFKERDGRYSASERMNDGKDRFRADCVRKR